MSVVANASRTGSQPQPRPRSHRRARRSLRRWGAGAFLVAVLLFLFLPMALIVAFSFNASPTLSFPVTGLTTRWYGEALGDEQFTGALRNNLLGLPLDLAAINIARGRDTGVPSLNEAREQLYAASGSTFLLSL